ncbi:unnamed protein product [Meloidogyne enterolobii]|uniref:Uncharacterized protein n=1 Tax=Meloidogyne enterolobii TaxID=390850 RepID=A0ACB1B451_MELEN
MTLLNRQRKVRKNLFLLKEGYFSEGGIKLTPHSEKSLARYWVWFPKFLFRLELRKSFWSCFELKKVLILCYGGLCSRGQSLCDLWELDINELYNQKILQQKQLKSYIKQQNTDDKKHFWRQIPPLEHRLPSRLWHCSVLMGEEAILIYGGMNEAPSRESPFVHTLLVYRISPPSLRQLALNALASLIVERWIAQTTTTKIDNNKSV